MLKLDYIWPQLLANDTILGSDVFVPIFPDLNVTVDLSSDFLPANRTRVIHGSGMVCGVERVIHPNNPRNRYTGVLQTGSKLAIMRISSFLPPSSLWATSL